MEKHNSNQRIRIKSDNVCGGVRHVGGSREGKSREEIEGLLVDHQSQILRDTRSHPGEAGDGTIGVKETGVSQDPLHYNFRLFPGVGSQSTQTGKHQTRVELKEGRVTITHAVRGHAEKFEFYFEGKTEPLEVFKVGR